MGAEMKLVGGKLHDDKGRLAQRGWATGLVCEYDRSRIKVPAWRIKEWDYYLVSDDEYAVALTVGDMGYCGLVSAAVVDFANATSHTESVVPPLPLGSFHMPSDSSSGITLYESDKVSMCFGAVDGVRTLSAFFKNFDGNEDLYVDVVLDQWPRDTMVIATPWTEDQRAFYYNQKTVGMRAQGTLCKGSLTHTFEPCNSFGLLDWGRGVWTRDNQWFWGVAQGMQNGHVFAMNLGYGFGDTSAASENMLFVDGIAHKLHRVDFGIPVKAKHSKRVEDGYRLMEPWHVTDDEGRLDLVFTPLLDRSDWMDFKVVLSDQHQVFGTFDGMVILDDGTQFPIRGLRGEAEVVHNRY